MLAVANGGYATNSHLPYSTLDQSVRPCAVPDYPLSSKLANIPYISYLP